ncbi:DNA methyltransferase [uncultured Thiodictyon sp.]|jgi:adenine-specific DNA-methyltransferase|uniref:DNA methyltransferase n=1 Tax=uncultured Thiodictyon sp. TaxID=1846217 RepID=UPI0025FEB329|nr:DNA methyltransferase [uncultured Thiodictyon sp.]
MPELFFKGKEFVFNHHLAVPFRPLVPDPKRSIGESGENGRLDGNLIIHGDNLHALKALLPLYAGKVDCIYIEIAPDVPRAPWSTIWDDVDQNRQAKANLTAIFGRDEEFDSPKPTALVSRVLEIAARNDSLVLDSFAGSGTTGHAVLAANAKDRGNRRFILVECEDYADTLTAERVRRVINGYKFQGTQREELHRERLTFTSLKKADTLLNHVESIKHLEAHRFDRIKAEVKDGELIVTGEREVTQKTEGLGGEFTYCTLGAAVEMDKLLTGENLPAFDQLGALLFHMATNQARPIAAQPEEVAGVGYLGASSAQHVWLIYRPDLNFLKSRDAALTLSRAKAIAAAKPDKPHLVYAPARFVSKRVLEDAGLPCEVAFAPLPFALYRVERPQ